MRLFIDVREPEEYATRHVEGALNLPPAKLMGDLHELNDVSKDTELILYCVSGSRSNAAMPYLRAKGFTNIVNGINQDQVVARYS